MSSCIIGHLALITQTLKLLIVFFIKMEYKKRLTKNIQKEYVQMIYIHWCNVNQNMQQHFCVY